MNAKQLTDSAIAHIEDSDPDVLIINYANPDMVGHTGDFAAAIDAVETVDMEFNRLVEYLHADGAHVLVTSDHGNAEILGTAEEPNTAHTTSDVPFVYISPTANGQQKCITQGGSLRDIAPTILELLDVQKPEQMSGESLIDTC
jgi:2,3-bisphosphoglycerate-independent phosphoglycerate mutase